MWVELKELYKLITEMKIPLWWHVRNFMGPNMLCFIHIFIFSPLFWKRSGHRLLESLGANIFQIMYSRGFHAVSNHLRSFFTYLQKEIIHINRRR